MDKLGAIGNCLFSKNSKENCKNYILNFITWILDNLVCKNEHNSDIFTAV